MAMKSSKAQGGATTPITIRFDGGLNYAEAPTQIADNELTRALNVIYNSQTGTPMSRYGTDCVTASALGAPIRALYYYEKSATDKWLVCASGAKLYYLSTDAWVEIGALTDTTTVPSFLAFNGKLLIADGGTDIRRWDGTTYDDLNDGLNATALAEVGNRVVANSTTSNDLVTLSAVEDETKWNTATQGAIGIRAGYGDNMAVNAFGVFGHDLFISKRGDAHKMLYRLNTADISTVNWQVVPLSSNNAAQNAQCMVSAFNNVFLVDDNGFKSVKGVTEYGDLQIDMLGGKVNTQFGTAACDGLVYLPIYTALWYLLSDRIYAYHRIQESDGQVKHAFTDLQFQQGRIRAVCQVDDTVYLAGHNGYLYKIDPSLITDEVSPAVTANYPTVLKTKRFSFFGGGILRKTSVEFRSPDVSSNTQVLVKANTAEVEGTLLKTVTVVSTEALADATEEVAVATTELSKLTNDAWIEHSSNRVRGSSIQWLIDSIAGRWGVEGLTAEVALVT